MPGWCRIASTATLSPCTMLNTPSGTPGVLQQLRHEHRGAGVLLGRLQDERVPARDRVREHPHGDHRGEVERRDAGDDPEGLPDRVDVDRRSTTCSENPPFSRFGIAVAYSMFSRPRWTSPIASRDHLAVLLAHDPRELGLRLLEQLAEPEEDVGALRQRRRAPALERLPRRLDRRVELLGRGEVDLVGLDAGGGVVDGAGPAGLAGDDLAADPVGDAFHGYRSSTPGRVQGSPGASPSTPASGRYPVPVASATGSFVTTPSHVFTPERERGVGADRRLDALRRDVERVRQRHVRQGVGGGARDRAGHVPHAVVDDVVDDVGRVGVGRHVRGLEAAALVDRDVDEHGARAASRGRARP